MPDQARRLGHLLRDHPLLIVGSAALFFAGIGLLLLVIPDVRRSFFANFAPELVSIGISAAITAFIVERALSAHERAQWNLPRENLLRELRPGCGILLLQLETVFRGFDSLIHGEPTDLYTLDVVACPSFRDEFVKFKDAPYWVPASPQEYSARNYLALAASAYRDLGSYSIYVEPLRSRNQYLIDQEPEFYRLFQRIEMAIRDWNSIIQLIAPVEGKLPAHELWQVFVQQGIDAMLGCFDALFDLALYIGRQLNEEVYESKVYTPSP